MYQTDPVTLNLIIREANRIRTEPVIYISKFSRTSLRAQSPQGLIPNEAHIGTFGPRPDIVLGAARTEAAAFERLQGRSRLLRAMPDNNAHVCPQSSIPERHRRHKSSGSTSAEIAG